jgi:hypothetical protein
LRKIIQLDYFIYSKNTHYSGSEVRGRVKNYVNLDVDTIWLSQEDQALVLPEDIEWFCGACEEGGWEHDIECRKGCLRGCETDPIRCLAVNFPSWTNPGDDVFDMGSVELLVQHQVQELLLVVGKFEPLRLE